MLFTVFHISFGSKPSCLKLLNHIKKELKFFFDPRPIYEEKKIRISLLFLRQVLF